MGIALDELRGAREDITQLGTRLTRHETEHITIDHVESRQENVRARHWNLSGLMLGGIPALIIGLLLRFIHIPGTPGQ